MSEETRDAFRKRCLQSLATTMTKVNRLSFSQAGSPVYNEHGEFQAIGPLRIPDTTAGFEHIMKMARKFQTAERCGSHVNSQITEESDSYCDIGPFSDTQSFMASMLDQHQVTSYDYCRGEVIVLRQFIQWISQRDGTKDFVLAHPDLDLQNILVDTNGDVLALVDWDRVAAVPRSLGCSFPKWLTRDWDPEAYCHSSRPENTPRELIAHRKFYVQTLGEELTRGLDGGAHLVPYSTAVRQSPVIESLRRAVTHPMSKQHIVDKICGMVAQLTCQKHFQVKVLSYVESHTPYCSAENEDGGNQVVCTIVSENKSLPRTTSGLSHRARIQDLASMAPCTTVASTENSDPALLHVPTQGTAEEIATEQEASTYVARGDSHVQSSPHLGLTQARGDTVLKKHDAGTLGSTDNPQLRIASLSRKLERTTRLSRKKGTRSDYSTDRSIKTNSSNTNSTRTTNASNTTKHSEHDGHSTPPITPPNSQSLSLSFSSSRKNVLEFPMLDEEEATRAYTLAPDSIGRVRDGIQGKNSLQYDDFNRREDSKSPCSDRETSNNLQTPSISHGNAVTSILGPADALEGVNCTILSTLDSRAPNSERVDLMVKDGNSRAHSDDKAPVNPATKHSSLSENKAMSSSPIPVTSDGPITSSRKHSVCHEGMQTESDPEFELTKLSPPTTNNTSFLPSRINTQPSSGNLRYQQQPKTSFGRRLMKKLVFTCHAPDLESTSHRSEIARRDLENRVPNLSQKKRKGLARWLKKLVRKTRKANQSSPSTTFLSTDTLFLSPQSESSEGNSVSGSSIPTATNVFDLENLEPVSEETLEDQGFHPWQIILDLGVGKFDEARMQRLQAGFFALLDSL